MQGGEKGPIRALSEALQRLWRESRDMTSWSCVRGYLLGLGRRTGHVGYHVIGQVGHVECHGTNHVGCVT